MKTELRESMASGVFVEVRDAVGNTLGHAVYAPWKGYPLPRTGDTMICTIVSTISGRRAKLRGRVRSRHFELQHDEDGCPTMWVRLLLEQVPDASARRARPAVFSQN